MPLPPMLRRLLGDTNESENDSEDDHDRTPRMVIPPLKPTSRPPGAAEDWIWIPADALSDTGVVLAVLRKHAKPINTQDLVAEIRKVKPDAVTGTIYNILARVKDELLDETGEGWKLRRPENAPLFHGDAAWGPKEAFVKSDLAAHRREVILHILRANQGGLLQMQIVRQLESPDMCRAPVNKDLIKADMEVLRERGLVRRIGNSRLWAV